MMKKLQYSQKVTLNKIEYKTARKKEEEKTFSFLPIPCLNYTLFSSVLLPSRKREYLPFVLSEWVSCFGLDFSVYSSLLRISGFSLLLHLKHFLVSLSQTTTKTIKLSPFLSLTSSPSTTLNPPSTPQISPFSAYQHRLCPPFHNHMDFLFCVHVCVLFYCVLGPATQHVGS